MIEAVSRLLTVSITKETISWLVKMDQDFCKSITCPDGNCVGCRDGEKWCGDPSCAPYCRGCRLTGNVELMGNITTAVILVVLVAALFIVWFVYGPALFRPTNLNFNRL